MSVKVLCVCLILKLVLFRQVFASAEFNVRVLEDTPGQFGCFLAKRARDYGMTFADLQRYQERFQYVRNLLSRGMELHGDDFDAEGNDFAIRIASWLASNADGYAAAIVSYVGSESLRPQVHLDYWFYSYFATVLEQYFFPIEGDKTFGRLPRKIDLTRSADVIAAVEHNLVWASGIPAQSAAFQVKTCMSVYDSFLAGGKMAYAEEWQNLCSQLRVVPMESKIFGDVRSSLALSPMVEWLLRQERLSVSPHQLFDKALSIYHDAWMAFGAIGELLYLDVAGNSQRKTTAVLTSKLMPVLVNKEDPLGAQYHFWNYILQMISRPRPVTLFTLSFGHELIWQRGDWSDHKADQLGINVGRAFLRGIEQVDYCKRWSSSGNTSLGGLYK